MMKKELILCIVACLLVLSIVMPVMAFTGDGSGTSGDPYQITTRAQWNEMDSYVSGAPTGSYFKLMNDLSWFGYPYVMIQRSAYTLDGNGHTISDISIVNNTENYVGLIQYHDGDGYYFRNLYLKNITVSSSRLSDTWVGGGSSIRMGILVGYTHMPLQNLLGYNIFIDPTSSVTWSGNATGDMYSGVGSIVGVHSTSDTAASIDGSVSLANISILGNVVNWTGFTDTTSIGGLSGFGAYSTNSIYAGNMIFSGTPPLSVNIHPISGSLYGIAGSNSYYDRTKNIWYVNGHVQNNLSTSDMTSGDYTRFTNINKWAENTFNPGGGVGGYLNAGLTIGNESLSGGYPIPYVFYPYDRIYANFTPSSTTPHMAQMITFTDTTMMTAPLRPDGTAYTDRRRADTSNKTYYWTFGDNTTSTQQNPSKIYLTNGDMPVTLTVTNAHYSNVSITQHIIVSGSPIPTTIPTTSPTPTPTWTGTPVPTTVVPTGTPTPTLTPTPTGTPTPASNASVRWTDLDGVTITSAYTGKDVKFYFNTGVAGINPPPWQMDNYLIYLYKKNIQTGEWVLCDEVGHDAPDFNIVYGNTLYPVDPHSQTAVFFGVAMQGWGQINFTKPTDYRAYLVAFNHTVYPPYQYVYAYADIAITDNPYLMNNLGGWAQSVGGDGLRYLIAVIIIIILVCLPFLIFRMLNLYIEMFMLVLGLGISSALGLIDLVVLMGLMIGIGAIFVLIWRSGGGNQ